MMNLINQLDHEDEFARAWADPRNTRYELPPVDVNQVLAKNYVTSEDFTFTRAMLWDMETKKAWRPDRYIPTVVRQGTANAWGKHPAVNSNEAFTRSSEQRLWLEPDEYGIVIEHVCLNDSEQAVTFIGAEKACGQDNNLLRAGTGQPVFHVEHAVGGPDSRPLNRWRIVHLTDSPDLRMVERFARLANDRWLPEFIEIYIRDDLGIGLTRRVLN
jgi:hypothetical protein